MLKNYYFETNRGTKMFKGNNIDEAMSKARDKNLIVYRVMDEKEAAEQSILTSTESWNVKSERIGKIRI